MKSFGSTSACRSSSLGAKTIGRSFSDPVLWGVSVGVGLQYQQGRKADLCGAGLFLERVCSALVLTLKCLSLLLTTCNRRCFTAVSAESGQYNFWLQSHPHGSGRKWSGAWLVSAGQPLPNRRGLPAGQRRPRGGPGQQLSCPSDSSPLQPAAHLSQSCSGQLVGRQGPVHHSTCIVPESCNCERA